MPMVVSLFLFIIYWVIFSTGKKMAIQGSWNAAFAMWLPTMVLLPLGMFLTYKATSDSSLFNADRYFGWVKIFWGKRRIKRVDLNHIAPTANKLSAEELNAKIIALSNLCRQFESDYKLHKNFVYSIARFSMADSYDKLHDIDGKYKQLLCNLTSVDKNDKYSRELLYLYPTLNVEKYKKLSDLSFKIQAMWVLASLVFTIFFPITIALYLLVLGKRNKVKRILQEIIRINDLVNDSLVK